MTFQPRLPQQLLAQAVAEAEQARRYLDFSAEQTRDLPDSLAGATAEQLAQVEALTSRFARTVDLLVNKLLRAIDAVELLPPGTLLDTIHRAEKRGLTTEGTRLRELKQVRNMIAHDYAGGQLPDIFAYCRQQKLALDDCLDRSLAHARAIISRGE